MRRALGIATSAGLMLLVAVALLLGAEGVFRCWLRWRDGRWPATLPVAFEQAQREVRTLYRRHPYLLVAPREGARDTRTERIAINSLGYRSPERPREKPSGVARVVCSGGSTTYDVLAPGNAATWPAQLEAALVAGGRRVEVWNAGFPAWTTLENVIALETRDVDLEPDVVILYQGINDLQPLAHDPVDPQYAGFHAEYLVTSLGFGDDGVPWYRRSVLAERASALLLGRPPRAVWQPTPAGAVRTSISPEGLRVFERNVRSFVAVARAHGADALLATQPLHSSRQTDRIVYEQLLPDLDPSAVPAALEQLNDVLRRLARDLPVALADVARDVAWTDADFLDPMHTSAGGSRKLAAALQGPVARLLDARLAAAR